MKSFPKVLKARKEENGQVVIDFKDNDGGKDFGMSFSEIRGGICWPVKQYPAYLAVIGLFSNAKFGNPNSLMLIYEKEYPDATALAVDAYNLAKDWRFNAFYTDRQLAEWMGFNFDFQKRLRAFNTQDVQIMHCPFTFSMGRDVLKRLAVSRAIQIPSSSIFLQQTTSFGKEAAKLETAQEPFYAINALRFLVVPWDQERVLPAFGPGNQAARNIPVEGWA